MTINIQRIMGIAFFARWGKSLRINRRSWKKTKLCAGISTMAVPIKKKRYEDFDGIAILENVAMKFPVQIIVVQSFRPQFQSLANADGTPVLQHIRFYLVYS